MFYHVDLLRQVDLEPRMFGPQLKQNISDKVIREAQGTVLPSVGYIIAVTDVDPQGRGLIRSDSSGLATFKVKYRCITMRLWPGEVVDAEVELTNRYGIRCKVGPYRIFVSEKNMPDDYLMKEDNGQTVWVNDQEADSVEIREGSQVRVCIENVQLQPGRVGGVASMKKHFLGVIAM